MNYRYINFAAGFGDHLRGMGIDVGVMAPLDIHFATTVEAPVWLSGVDTFQHPAIIGAFTYFGQRSVFQTASIGRYCSVSEQVQIGMQRHPMHALTTSLLAYRRGNECLNFESHLAREQPGWQRTLECIDFDSAPFTSIGNDVWIGCNVYIKDGVTVGDGAVIGAHSVVTRDVPAYAVVAGTPARIIRDRFPERTIERLLELQWWNYNILDIGELDLNDIDRAIGTIEDRISAGMEPYMPAAVNWVDEYERFQSARDYLTLQRA